MSRDLVGLAEIEDARGRLKGVAVTTPLDRSRALSEIVGGPAFIKCENLQRTGSYKIRGAYNLISRLEGADLEAGVVAASAGNHAQGVALAASLVGTPATVFMPQVASLPKVEATKRYGAEVVLTGRDFGEAHAAATAHASSSGATFVPPFEHPHIIAGQGTVGCEISEQLAEVASVVVPVGGGGLISGIAAALKTLRPEVRIVGVQAAGAAAWPPSLEKGAPVTLERMSTIADGIAANSPGDLTFNHVRRLVDEIVCVTDDELAEATLFAAERMKLVLEPSGAAGVAAALQGLGGLRPPVVIVLSGGNVDPLLLVSVLRFGLSSSGRYFAFKTRLVDRPGELAGLIGIIAAAGANLVGVEHARDGIRARIGEVDVTLHVETRGRAHIDGLTGRLTAAGYAVEPL